MKNEPVSKLKICLTIFLSALYISAVTFGSGYVIVSIIKKRFVDQLKWIDEDEMTSLISLAQSSPGVIAANTAHLVGYKICGKIGAFSAILGMALPPLIFVSIISVFYTHLIGNPVVGAVMKGMQAGVCAVVCDVVVSLLINLFKNKKPHLYLKIAILASSFIAAFVFNIDFIFIILFMIIFNLILHYANKKAVSK